MEEKKSFKKKLIIGFGIIAIIMGFTNPDRLVLESDDGTNMLDKLAPPKYFNFILFSYGSRRTMIMLSTFNNHSGIIDYTSEIHDVEYIGAFKNFFIRDTCNDVTTYEVVSS